MNVKVNEKLTKYEKELIRDIYEMMLLYHIEYERRTGYPLKLLKDIGDDLLGNLKNHYVLTEMLLSNEVLLSHQILLQLMVQEYMMDEVEEIYEDLLYGFDDETFCYKKWVAWKAEYLERKHDELVMIRCV